MPQLKDDGLEEDLQQMIAEDEFAQDAEWPFSAVGTISDYVKIRRKFADSRWFRARLLPLDPMEHYVAFNDLGKRGFPEGILRGLIGLNLEAFDGAAIWLLDFLWQRDEGRFGPHAASRGEILLDSDVRFLCAWMQEMLSARNMEIPQSLIYLNSVLLLGPRPKIKERMASRRFACSVFSAASRLYESGKPISARSVAELLGVSVTTITRARDRLLEHWENEGDDFGEHALFRFTEKFAIIDDSDAMRAYVPHPFPF